MAREGGLCLFSPLLGFTLFEGAARWLVIAAGATIEIAEAFLLMWLSRRRRPEIGMSTMVGRVAVVAVACRPEGQVRIDGELWSARCDAGCDPGERVRITGWEGLMLTVAPEG